MSLNNYPSNSQRPVTGAPSSKPVEESVPQFEKLPGLGSVTRRRKSLGRRFFDTFFAGNTDSVFGYLLKDVLVPALQNTAIEIVHQGIEKAIYGEVRTTRPRTSFNNSSRPHITYNQPVTRVSSVGPNNALTSSSRRMSSHPSSMEMDDIVLSNKTEAQALLEKMSDILEQYEVVSAANVYELVGQTPQMTDYKWGWTDMQFFRLKPIGAGGWVVVFPPLEYIR